MLKCSIAKRRHYQAIAVSDRLFRVRNFRRLFNVNITFVENLEFILAYISSILSFAFPVQFVAGRHSVIFLVHSRSAITKKSSP
ncbi:hypothetical protein ANTRET_LOCUS9091 [Anthophora retusa]